MTKQYKYVDPSVTLKEMTNVINRPLTDQEERALRWLSETEYETRGVLLDLFKEINAR